MVMLLTLATKLEHDPNAPAGPVFFIKIAEQHTLQAVVDALQKLLHLSPSAQMVLRYNSAVLAMSARPLEVCARCADCTCSAPASAGNTHH